MSSYDHDLLLDKILFPPVGTGSSFAIVDNNLFRDLLSFVMKLNSKYQTNCYDNIAISRKQLKLHLEKKSVEAQNEFKLLINSITINIVSVS